MKLNFDNPWVARIFSIVLSLGLFLYVNILNQNQFLTNAPTDGASLNGSEIISNLPIEVNVDTDRFFVEGIPASATLRIEGPEAIIFQTIATQGYSVTTQNLNELGEGTHRVDLKVEGLSDKIAWSVSPSSINITIEEKIIAEHPIEVEIDESINIANGYEIVEPTISQETVQLSGAASTMEQIDKVVVRVLSNERDINADVVMSAPIIVLNANNEPLNVNTSPSQIEVNVPVIRTQRSIPIVLREGNGKVVGYRYAISLTPEQDDKVTVRGTPEAIETLENFPITIDFNRMTESRVVTVPIDEFPEGIDDVNKESIEVLIEVTQLNENTAIED